MSKRLVRTTARFITVGDTFKFSHGDARYTFKLLAKDVLYIHGATKQQYWTLTYVAIEYLDVKPENPQHYTFPCTDDYAFDRWIETNG